MLSSCSNWNYKHPRVRTESDKVDYVDANADLPNKLADSLSPNLVSDKSITNPVIFHNRGNQNKTEYFNNKKTNDSKSGSIKNVDNKLAKSPFTFITKIHRVQHDKMAKAKSVKKEGASGWVRIMIILFVVGLILLLIGIFLTVFISGAFWWLFYGIGALLILAGVIVLILGLLGLI
jgi:hypothetical protein